MAKDWDYAKASKWMAEHGGPQKALDTVKDYYTKKGFKEGAASKNPVIVVVGAVALATGIVGKSVYDKIRAKRLLKKEVEVIEQDKVKKAEIELLDAMKQKSMSETEGIIEMEEEN